MEILLVILLLGVFIGPSIYRLYERFRRPQAAKAARPGPSYGRRMLGMLMPVFVLAVALTALTVGLYYLAGR